MKKFLFLLAFLVSNILIFAQDLENSKWYFGDQAALDFNNPGPDPTSINNSTMTTIEGCASISDSSGNLLFYTDGRTVWDNSHSTMTNGTNIGGDGNTTQSAVIVPHLGNPDIYYIFTANGISSGDSRSGFSYSIIDISLSSGLGSVTAKRQSLFYLNSSLTTVQIRGSDSEKMTSHYDAVNNVVWVVLYHDLKLLSYKIDINGINTTADGNSPLGFTPDLISDQRAGIKISPDGTKFVFTRGNHSSYLYDFDINTGDITNPTTSTNLSSAYSAEFSPDSNFLYLSGGPNGLTQNDVSGSTIGAPNIISSNQFFGTLQLGPNNKIYIARDNSNHLAVINNPNNSGIGSNFVLNGVSLGSNTSRLGLPQKVVSIPNYDFITTWQVDSSDTTITIPTHPSETYNYDVDWGDGSSSTGETGDATHTYTTAGTYTISISGDFPRIYFNQGLANRNSDKIISVDQWGSQIWTSMESAFKGCTYLTILATDNPDLSIVTDMSHMFEYASTLNQNINDWDVSNVTNLSYLFYAASSFNQPIENWDVSSVTNMDRIFKSATSFNQPIGNWDVSNVTWIAGMFEGATNFNQQIGNWDLISVIGATANMFKNATNFNQPIGNWNMSNVTDISNMFNNATSFDQPIGNWDVSNVIHFYDMFINTNLSTSNYDNLLLGWSTQNLYSNVIFDVGNTNYLLEMLQDKV